MRSTISTAVLLSALSLVSGQTFTDCDPTKKTCPANAGLGKTITTDFTKGESSDWSLAAGTSMSYGSDGAQFTIKSKTDAPTISSVKYIMFGKVSVVARASPGTGTVSSFILESDDLDEVDWEWLGSTDNSVESNFFGKGNTTTYDRAIYHPVSTPIETFHTYTIDWTKDSLKWLIDDVVIRTLQYSDALALGGKNYPQTPMRIKMGNWIGCQDAAAAADPKTKGTCEWAGGPIDLAKGPFVMYAKSVTIQDYGCGGDYTYTDMSGSYQSISSSCKAGTSDSSSGSSSVSSAKPSSTQTSSITVSSGGVLIETSSTLSTVKSSVTAASNATTTSSGTPSTTPASVTSKTSGTPSSTSPAAQQSTNAASSLKPKHEYGVLDMGVLALGLGLGYLVM